MEDQKMQQQLDALQGVIDEAQTVQRYIRQASIVENDTVIDTYREIISDELNHMVRFIKMFVDMTGIEVAEE